MSTAILTGASGLSDTSSSPGLTVLSNNGLASISWQQTVYNQIVQRKQGEIEAAQQKLEDAFDNKATYYEAQSNQLAKVKASISNAALAVDNGQEGASDISDMLLQMRIVVGQYGEADTDEEKQSLKSQFDEYVDQINRTADTYSPAYNPIGNVTPTVWTPNDISFTNDVAGNETTMFGTYIGSDFAIEADDGTTWVPDRGSSTITQYTVFNTQNEPDSTKGAGFASTRNGIVLNSYDPSTGRISITVDPNNNPETVTGTLKQGGLGLMQSWFYGGLDTEAARKQAVAALDKADSLMVGATAQLGGMSAQIKSADMKTDNALNELNSQQSDAMKQQMAQAYTAQVKAQQELQVLQTTFQNMSSQQSYYASIFAGAGKSPLFDLTS